MSKRTGVPRGTPIKHLLATGCRISEVLALEWSDIDLESGVVSVNKTLNRYQETNTPKSKSGYGDISIDKATLLSLSNIKTVNKSNHGNSGGLKQLYSLFLQKNTLMLAI